MLKKMRARMASALAPKEPSLRQVGENDFNMMLSPFSRNPPSFGTKELLESYQNLPWLRAVTGKVGQAVGTTQWRLFVVRDNSGKPARRTKIQQAHTQELRKRHFKRLDTGQLEEIEDHPMLELLTHGNDRMSGQNVFGTTQVHLDLVGESFWLLEKNDLGVPIGIWPIPPHWVRSLPRRDHAFYQMRLGNRDVEVPVTEVIAFFDSNPADPYGRGTGTAKSLGDELETDSFAGKYLKNFFYNNARPDIVVSADNLKREETDRLEEGWLKKHQGFWNSFKPYFINRKVDVKEIGKGLDELQMTQLRRQERDTIIQVFGIPPEKFGILSASNRCHSEDTECLTRGGWKKWHELTPADEIGTWNEVEERLEYQSPQAIHVYDYYGPMHHWHSIRYDVLVTPNHRMYVQSQFNGPWEFRESQDLFDKSLQMVWRGTGGNFQGGQDTVKIPFEPYRTGNRGGVATICEAKYGGAPENGEYWETDASIMAEFLGYFISEGSFADHRGRDFGIRIHQNRGPVADRMVEVCETLGFGNTRVLAEEPGRNSTNRSTAQMTISFSSKSIWYFLQRQVGSYCWNKRIPRMCFDWPIEAQQKLLDALMEGDGHWYRGYKAKSGYYATTSEGLADDIQQLCIQLGYRARKRGVTAPDAKRPIWNVSVSPITTYTIGQYGGRRFVNEVDYKGKVWCVTVPNGVFFTRRNGTVVAHGNSTISAADVFWQRDVIMPRAEAIRTVLQRKLVPMFDERLILDFESPVVEDAEHELDVMRSNPRAFSLNEWRAAANRAPLVEGGDMFVQDLNQTVVSGPEDDPNQQDGGGNDQQNNAVRSRRVEKQFEVQSIAGRKSQWNSREEFLQWARDNNYRTDKVDETDNFWRLRQRNPNDFEELRTICINPNDVRPGSSDCRVQAVGGERKMVTGESASTRDRTAIRRQVEDALKQKLEEKSCSRRTGG